MALRTLTYRLLSVFCLVVITPLGGTAAFASDANSVPSAAEGQSEISSVDARVDLEKVYRLGAGDKLRVTVFGHDDLSGEFLVGSEGNVSLALVGDVGAANLTVEEFRNAVVAALLDGYLKNPRVSVEVLNYRPFYILGEIETGGEYPYQAGMTVLNAVALAGGYTYRANNKWVFISREGVGEQKLPATQATSVLPGDVIRVPQRLF